MMGNREQSFPTSLFSMRHNFIKSHHIPAGCLSSMHQSLDCSDLTFVLLFPSSSAIQPQFLLQVATGACPTTFLSRFHALRLHQLSVLKLAAGRLSQLGLDNPVTRVHHFFFRNCFLSLVSFVCVSFSIFEVGQSDLHIIYEVEWPCFVFWFFFLNICSLWQRGTKTLNHHHCLLHARKFEL